MGNYKRIFRLFITALCVAAFAACSTNYRPNPNANANMASSSPSGSTSTKDPYKAVIAATDELTKVPSMVRLDPKGYIKGKAVQFEQRIDREDKEKKEKPRWIIDKLVVLEDMTPPQKLDEIGTVVLRKCEEVPTGSYGQIMAHEVVGDDVKGFGWKCEITVIDKTMPAVIARKTFEAKPGEYTSVAANTKVVTVPPPLTDMREYLKSLERK